ncbi:MAG: ABC transporter permease [Thermodesulfobacteriota bacterium]
MPEKMKISLLLTMTIMELKRMAHDLRRVLLLVLGPLAIGLVFGLVFYHYPKDIDLTLFVDRQDYPASSLYPETTNLINTIEGTDRFSVTRVFSVKEAFSRLYKGRTRAVVVIREGKTTIEAVKVTIDVTDRILQQLIRIELPRVLNRCAGQAALSYLSEKGVPFERTFHLIHPFHLELKTNEWKDIRYFDLAASGVIVLFIVGICLLMSVTTVTAERSSGTLERILASPYKNSEIILGKFTAYTVLAAVVSVLVIFSLKLTFGIVLGNLFLVFLFSILIGGNAVALGLLVSAVTRNELESIMAGILCWFLAMILMGFTWPLETMHPLMTWVSRLNPFLYGLQAIRHINLNHWGFDQVWFNLVVLVTSLSFQALLAIRFFRREIG